MYGTAEAIEGRLYVAGGYNWTVPPDGNLHSLLAFTPSVQHAPVANDLSVVTSTISVTIPVLDHASDEDGDLLSVVEVTNGAKGAVVVNADGTVTYTLTTFFSGMDTFTYTVSDGLQTATGTVTVNLEVPPSQGILLIQSQIAGLPLGKGEKNSLTSKLDAAQKSLAKSNENAAANQLDALIRQVWAFNKSGRLDSETASTLIDELQQVIGLIS
jgi:hypothetical protein